MHGNKLTEHRNIHSKPKREAETRENTPVLGKIKKFSLSPENNSFLPFQIPEYANCPSKVCESCVDYINRFEEYSEKVKSNQDAIIKSFAEILVMKSESSDFPGVSNLESKLLLPTTVKRRKRKPDLETEYPSNAEGELTEILYESLPSKRLTRTKDVAAAKTIAQEGSESESDIIKDITVKRKRRRDACSEESFGEEDIVKRKDYLTKLKEEQSKLNVHMKAMNALICDLCHTEEANTYKELMQHFKKEHNKKGYIACCDRQYSLRFQVYDHIKFHLDKEAFKCNECGKCFETSLTLRTHQLNHVPEEQRQFQCDDCGQAFAKAWMCKTHILEKHGGAETFIYNCDQCEKRFKSKHRLHQHVKLKHDMSNQQICPQCGVTFLNMTSLTLHLDTHNPEREKRACHLCGKYVFHLNRHLEAHVRETVACDECGKELRGKNALKTHKKMMHNKDAPVYPCTVCSKSFRSKYKLSEHLSIHTGVKKFTCYFCPEQFAAATNRTKHCKLRHPKDLQQWRDAKYHKPTDKGSS